MFKLTDKEELFCTHIAAGESVEQAALAAGYAPTTASSMKHKWKKKPKLVLTVARLQKENEDATNLKVADDRMATSTIEYDALDFSNVDDRRRGLALIAGSIKSSTTSKIKALDLLNKMDGSYITEMSNDVNIQIIQAKPVSKDDVDNVIDVNKPLPTILPFPEYSHELLD